MPNPRSAFNEIITFLLLLLFKFLCLCSRGNYIQIWKEPDWLGRNVFCLQGFALLGTLPFWNLPLTQPSFTLQAPQFCLGKTSSHHYPNLPHPRPPWAGGGTTQGNREMKIRALSTVKLPSIQKAGILIITLKTYKDTL